MTAEGPTPVTADIAATPVTPSGTTEIATLPPLPDPVGSRVDPRTGEPPRPWLIRLSTIFAWTASATAAASLLWTYWVAVEGFYTASWLTSQFHDLLPGFQALTVAGLTVTTLLAVISGVITGYYAWFGYRWSRIAGIVSASLSLLVLLLNPVGWAAIPLAAAGAGLLWTPRATAFFAAWQAHRHPETAFAPAVTSVFYGPLPRYRKA